LACAGGRAAFIVATLTVFVASAETFPPGPDPETGPGILLRAYPGQLAPTDKPNTVAWKDGTEMVYDDGMARTTLLDLLDHPCLRDQLRMPYPAGNLDTPPAVNHDPGRVRFEPFFRKMYGTSESEVQGHLVPVPWPAAGKGHTLRFTKVNGAAEALRRAGEAFAQCPEPVRALIAAPIGTFNWRLIAGSKSLSAHSFGIAVDFQLPRNLYRYWRWDMADASQDAAVCLYPESVLKSADLAEVVKIFEDHQFIWGGKWYHYDTMHFEYRPELLPDTAQPIP